ncbi:MAG: COR domain-containing protein, partial [candidate division KSB1 bacterium]
MSKTPPHIVEKIRAARERGETVLDLWGEKLTEIPPELFEADTFEEIWLNGNQITIVSTEMVGPKKLRWLVLFGNPLKTIADVPGLALDFDEYQRWQQKLKREHIAGLNLSRWNLPHLPELDELPQLTLLNLTSTQLSELPESVTCLQNLISLDLSFNRLKMLPENVTRLQNLATLNLRYNELTTLPESVTYLQNLTILNLDGNKLTALPESPTHLQNLTTLHLSRNQLTALPESFSDLQNLSLLDLSDNQLTTLPESLGDLQNLATLNLSYNELTTLPESVTHLQNLTTLNLSNNQLTALPGSIGDLQSLITLVLSHNQLTVFPESMTHFQNLTKLYLSSNQLTVLPVFLAHMPKLTTLHFKEREKYYSASPGEVVLSNNPITYPPKEVLAAGMEAVRSFFAQMEQQGKSKLYEAKLLLVGEAGAGKTSLLNKLLDENYVIPNPNEESTVGITVKTGWQFPLPQKPEVTFSANLWDFGGHEIQYMTHQFFLTSRALYVLLADERKQHTQFDYWFNIIKLLGKGSPVLVVLNEKNCKPITNFDYDSYRKFYHEDFKLERCEVDLAETGPRFVHLRNTVQRLLAQLPHIGDELPARWIDIRQALEQQRERNHIMLHEFKTLCAQHGIHKEIDQLTLSGYLHDLGVILHFQHDPQLADTLFLNPQWVVEAVYSVLDSDHAKKNKGRCTKGWMFEQWRSRGHDFSECNKLLSLMLKNNFELCYGLEGGSEEEYIAPQLLPSTRPPYEWNSAGNLHFRLQYPFMPKGIITRMIVRLHEWIEREADEGLVWERGVVLRKHGVRAQVTEEITKQEGLKVINIVLDGPPSAQKDLLADLRAELRAIHDKSFRGINVKEMVPIPEQPEIAVPYEHLLVLESKGIEKFIPQGLSEEVSVQRLLNGIEPRQKRRREYERYEEDRPVSVHIDFKPEMKQYVNQNVQQTNTSTFNFDLHFNSLQSSLNELREKLESVAPEQAKEIEDLRERLKKLEGTKEEDKAKAKESTALSKTRRL